MIYAEVALAAPLAKTLTYSVPDDLAGRLMPGMRLLTPLAGRLTTGYFLGPAVPPSPDQKIKAIKDILDQEPFFPAAMIPLFRWVADYYFYPIGEVIRGALPAGLTVQSGRRVVLTALGREKFADIRTAVDDQEYPWLADLAAKGELTPPACRKIWRTNGRRLLQQWADERLILINEELTEQGAREKKEVCISLNREKGTEVEQPALLKSEQTTLAIIERLTANATQTAPRREITREYKGAGKALRQLAAKGFIVQSEQRVFRDPFGEVPPYLPRPEQLTAEQQEAVNQINVALEKHTFTPFLLHGITSSGKTEVYLRATEKTLTHKKKALILVPEIALATQLEAHFYSRFGDRIALLHSGLTAGERFDQWLRVVRGEADVVIGARSAVFAPLTDIGLIVVDEEHDGSYKQEEGLRYNARDLAIMRASLEKCTVILGSATPSVVSFQHAKNGKYQLLSLTGRVEDRPLPEVRVIDLRSIPTVSGLPPLFSNEMISNLRENLEQQDQSLVFLNRRGFANFMLCRQCGETIRCRHCHITLTLHREKNELICHYCGFAVHGKSICAKCQSTQLIGMGFGTERIHAELTRLFPRARIARLDRDTVASRHDYLKILKGVHEREIDILIGTQMITKGHHFPGVTLVAIVWADNGLGLPDFRAGERTFQLLSQVTGRAGRGERPGRVVIQTYQPNHYSVVTARDHDYQKLFDQELASRAALKFPPFGRLINLRIDGKNEDQVQDGAGQLATAAGLLTEKWRNIKLLGPAPAPLSRLRGRYRWQLLLKGERVDSLHSFCRRLMAEIPATFRSGAVKLSVDVDPENML